MFANKTILITGGTGSFGKAFVRELLDHHTPKTIRIFSRDELKQWEMAHSLRQHKNFKKLRFFIGDVRDVTRLKSAFEDVDIVIHAAALKQVGAAEYNPTECIATNVMGAENVIQAALDTGAKKVIALSSDKAVSPVNLYGATKLCSDKLFVAANNIVGKKKILFSVVRYGNVMGSRGSVIPFFLESRKTKVLPITHEEMTRFNITLSEACQFVIMSLKEAKGGEIFVPKLPSYKITDLAKAISPGSEHKIVGIRPGEKIHEEMISMSDSTHTFELKDHFVITPEISEWDVLKTMRAKKAKKVKVGFYYNSLANKQWLNITQIRSLIKKHIDHQVTFE